MMDALSQNQRTFQMLECGDIQLSQLINEAFVMMGMTKRGKTTLGHYLSNESLKGYKEKGGELMLKSSSKTYSKAIIGSSNNSQTEIPNYFYPKIKLQGQNTVEKMVLMDCPGFQDSYGVHRIITNAYFNYRMFSKVANIKFILVVKDQDLNGTAHGLVHTIKGFLDNFKDWDKVSQSVMDATSFIISKVTRELPEVMISLEKLGRELNCSGLPFKYKQYFKDIIEHVIKNNKVYVFKIAQQNVLTPTNNTLLKDINAKTKFWHRQKIEQKNLVDMSENSFSIFKQIQQNFSQEDYRNQWNSLMDYFNQMVGKTITIGIQQVFKAIIRDTISKQEDSCKFFDDMVDAANINNYLKKEYESERNVLKRVLFESSSTIKNEENSLADNPLIYWIKKFKTVDQMYAELFQISSEQILKRSYQQIEDRSNSIMKLVKGFGRLARKRPDQVIISNYGYALFRRFEECKVFFLLLDGFGQDNANSKIVQDGTVLDFHYPLKEALSGIFQLTLDDIKRPYALSYSIPKDKKPQVYNQILKFYKGVDKGTKEDQIRILKSKETQLILQVSKYMLVKGNPEQKRQSIKDLNICRKTLQEELQYNPEDQISGKNKVRLIIQVIKNLGQFFKNLNMERQAIKCFDSISFVPKVLQIYTKLVEKPNTPDSQKRDILIEMSKYADKNGRTDISTSKLQQAYCLCVTYQEFQEVADLIIKQSSGTTIDRSANYLKDMLDKRLYKTLSEKDSKELQMGSMDFGDFLGRSNIH